MRGSLWEISWWSRSRWGGWSSHSSGGISQRVKILQWVKKQLFGSDPVSNRVPWVGSEDGSTDLIWVDFSLVGYDSWQHRRDRSDRYRGQILRLRSCPLRRSRRSRGKMRAWSFRSLPWSLVSIYLRESGSMLLGWWSRVVWGGISNSLRLREKYRWYRASGRVRRGWEMRWVRIPQWAQEHHRKNSHY